MLLSMFGMWYVSMFAMLYVMLCIVYLKSIHKNSL